MCVHECIFWFMNDFFVCVYIYVYTCLIYILYVYIYVCTYVSVCLQEVSFRHVYEINAQKVTADDHKNKIAT